MKYSAIIILLSIFFITSCTEKDEIYPRPNETIFITVDHDTAISLYDNQTYILNAETGDSSSTYSWNCNYSFILNTPQITVNYPGEFEVDIITNMVTQQFSITFFYSESPMYYPNSFSPNGDGMNDYWSPHGVNIDIDGFLLKIYDKNNHMLYKADEFFKSWDGTVEEEPCPVGYYYYVVKYKALNGEKHKDTGMIQLIQ
ncbi:MAG: gliding motility-associated C-terminal domain-containing protein [Bacteroidota bacterium]